jgi:CRP-like cAMP-binding protein
MNKVLRMSIDVGDECMNQKSTKRVRRRMGVQAVALSAITEKNDGCNKFKVIHERSQINFLSSALSKHFLFTAVNKSTMEGVCKSMHYVEIPAGSNIIQQGQIGDSFYVVDSGELRVMMKTEGQDEAKVIQTLRRGQCFGESVLMTVSMRRAASVRASVDCGAWVMHKRVYEEDVLAKSVGSSVEEFLKGVDVFYRLSPAVVRGIATRCELLEFPANTVIFKKGELSNDMYFIVAGKVAIIGDNERELSTYTTRGESFGEGAILTGKGRRTAGVVTRTTTSLLKLHADVIIKLFPLGVENLLDEKLALQVLKLIPGFEELNEQMLRDYGVTEDEFLCDPVLRSITLEPGALIAEERKPAEQRPCSSSSAAG